MVDKKDIRWEQRFSNYKNALRKFDEAIAYIKENFSDMSQTSFDEEQPKILEDIIKQGLIQSFEYTYELAWNVMRDYAIYQGNAGIHGSRSAIREALQMGLISEGKIWMEMVESRIRTSHTYDEKVINEIFNSIINHYHNAFKSFEKKMTLIKKEL